MAGWAASRPRLARADGAARLAFAVVDGTTRLTDLYQRTPCRVMFPRVPRGEPPEAVLVTTTGGLTGGDRVAVSVAAGTGARATVTAQAAEKLYRAGPDGDTRVDTALVVEPQACLEYLPQETILFDGARFDRTITAAVAATGRLLAVDLLVFGRHAHGERFASGRVHDRWRVTRADRPVWADALRLDGDIPALLDHPAGFGGAPAMATVILVAPDAGTWCGLARDVLAPAGRRAAATVLHGLLLARILAPVVAETRALAANLTAALRHAAFGHRADMPRVWQT